MITNLRTMKKNKKAKFESDNDYETDRDLSPSMTVAILAKNSLIVSEAEAVKILNFMYTMAEIDIDQYLNANKITERTTQTTHQM